MTDMSEEELEALAGAVEMALDWNLDVPEEDMKLYREYIEQRRQQKTEGTK